LYNIQEGDILVLVGVVEEHLLVVEEEVVVVVELEQVGQEFQEFEQIEILVEDFQNLLHHLQVNFGIVVVDYHMVVVGVVGVVEEREQVRVVVVVENMQVHLIHNLVGLQVDLDYLHILQQMFVVEHLKLDIY
jgi:hypothetical protein